MAPRIPERNKKPGVCYAVTDDGIELPVIDITHPAFAVEVTEPELSAVIDQSSRRVEAAKTIPAHVLRSLVENSVLMRGWMESSGTFMTGMMTYLNRLGPENLGEGWASPTDRQIAASLAPLSFRFRLRDVARLIADGLRPALVARPGQPVHLLNIGGGPAPDSLNGLMLIHREHPEWLAGRRISIHVLDLDREGATFGSRAAAALLGEGGPLHGLALTFEHVAYDWGDVSGLSRVLDRLEPDAVVAGSTEGALFDYGSDEEIVANLTALRGVTPDDFVMVGSVVRDEKSLAPRMRGAVAIADRPAIRYLGLDAFRTLALAAGWAVDRSLESVVHHAVSLRKT